MKEINERKWNQQRAFTLVELAIVLVIVGLLLGGVLKGQAMIDSARMKRAIQDYKNISAAVLTYRDQYKSWPGDDNRAQTLLGNTTLLNGDGDGRVDGSYASSDDTNESRQFWYHLRAADMVTGSSADTAGGTLLPSNPWGGQTGVTSSAISGFALGEANTLCYGLVPGDASRNIDTQLDDGVPTTGKVRGHASDTSYDASSNYTLCLVIG
ncbi:hypothetical protein GP5015_2494 [gamma proteobacterium HTCC5015]|nr:hypothetical protein GP5015_2494 [gamma proteobacterium HTCC5015]